MEMWYLQRLKKNQPNRKPHTQKIEDINNKVTELPRIVETLHFKN